MAISYLVFDLDDTLYPPNNGLWDELGQRILDYMVNRVGLDPAFANAARQRYYQEYGTTLRGLMCNHPGFDPDDYLAYVHNVDLSRWLAPNPALDAMLAALPQPKAIFTNGDTNHTRRVLNCLGVAQRFDVVVDIRAMAFENKPLPRAYEVLLERIKTPPAECVIMEDSLRNLRPARALGMTTILVGDGLTAPDPAVDFRVNTILETGEVIRKIARVKRGT